MRHEIYKSAILSKNNKSFIYTKIFISVKYLKQCNVAYQIDTIHAASENIIRVHLIIHSMDF